MPELKRSSTAQSPEKAGPNTTNQSFNGLDKSQQNRSGIQNIIPSIHSSQADDSRPCSSMANIGFIRGDRKTENPKDFNDETSNDSIVPFECDDLRR